MDVSRSAIDLSLLSEDLHSMLFKDRVVHGISRNDYALIGDAIMSLFVREAVLKNPALKPWANHLISNKAFSLIVQESGLDARVQNGGQSIHSQGTILEAIVGAIYWQHGYPVASQFISREIFPRLKKIISQCRKKSQGEVGLHFNRKPEAEVELMQFCQQFSLPSPEFAIIKKRGLHGKVLVLLKIPGFLEITETADSYIGAIRKLASRAKLLLVKKNLQPAPEKP